MITRLRYVEYFDYKYIVFLSDHLISPQKKSHLQAPDDLSVRRGEWVYADLSNQTVDG